VLKTPLGLPNLPAPLSRPGKKRLSPVARHWSGHTLLHGKLMLTSPVKPVLAEHQGESSFRTLSWKVAAEPVPVGGSLVFQVEEQLKDAVFPVSQVDQGVEAWKKDRALVRSLLQDGMAVRP
jgi:hypothetical protein